MGHALLDAFGAALVDALGHNLFDAFGYAEGMAKGIEEGMAKGELQRSLAIAQKMKQSGVSDPQIMEFTGLTLEQIKSLGK